MILKQWNKSLNAKKSIVSIFIYTSIIQSQAYYNSSPVWYMYPTLYTTNNGIHYDKKELTSLKSISKAFISSSSSLS